MGKGMCGQERLSTLGTPPSPVAAGYRFPSLGQGDEGQKLAA